MENINDVVKILRDGGIILYPTDTVWGIGCDATNPVAVQKVYKIKNRIDSKALVLLAENIDMICRYVKEIPAIVPDLIEVNDKPMTIIYPNAFAGNPPKDGEDPVIDKHYLAYNAVAEDGSIAIRIPMMDFCVDLCHKLGRPIVSTSANISGEPTPQNFDQISEEIKKSVDYICDKNLEKGSTGLSSQIIKVDLDCSVKIIRK